MIGSRQIIAACGIALITVFAGHDPFKSVALRDMFLLFVRATAIKKWWVDPQCVPGRATQTLDVKRRAGLRILGDARNSIGFKYENVSPMRLHKIVAEFVHEYLVAGINGAAGNDLPFAVGFAGRHSECGLQHIVWRINQQVLTIAHQPGEIEKEQELFRFDLKDLIILTRHHIDVVATADDELQRLLEDIRNGLRSFVRITDDAIQRRLHGSGRNFKWLQKVGSDSNCYYDRDQDHLYIFAPVGFPIHRSESMKLSIQRFSTDLDLFSVALTQRCFQASNSALEFIALGRRNYILFVTQEFFGVPQEQLAVFDVTAGEHGAASLRD